MCKGPRNMMLRYARAAQGVVSISRGLGPVARFRQPLAAREDHPLEPEAPLTGWPEEASRPNGQSPKSLKRSLPQKSSA